jgi:hypothetical protein
VRGLQRRGVPADLGTGAALLELRTYYAAYMIALVSVFWLLWTNHSVSGSLRRSRRRCSFAVSASGCRCCLV